jgi:hypothetical protein
LLQAANRITACAPQFDNQPCKPLDRPWRERYARQVPRSEFRGCRVSLWIELGISAIFLFLMVVLSVYITRFATIPLIRETIASVQKMRLAKQQKASN